MAEQQLVSKTHNMMSALARYITANGAFLGEFVPPSGEGVMVL